MLLTKTVMLKWTGKIKSDYINKGYFFTKMGEEFEVKVEDLPTGSGVLVDVKCDSCDKEIKNQIFQNYKKCLHENGEYYCRKCSTKLFGIDAFKKTKLNKSISFYDWCYKNLSIEEADDIISRWDYKINKCSPKDVTYKSEGFDRKGYWFKCDKYINHKSELKNICNFVKGQKNSINCNQCSSFAQHLIDLYGNNALELYWDFENNNKLGINPWKIKKCANSQKIYIKCQNSEKQYHSNYLISCNKFSSAKHRCPYCSNQKIHPKDSLGQYIIDNFGQNFLDKIWSDKNKKSAFEYAPFSAIKVWWRCIDEKHEDFKRRISESNNYDFRCPSCTQERLESILQEKVRIYLEQTNYMILHENKCTIVPRNPKTKYKLPFDNEIKELKLVIEVMGKQHYELSGWNEHTAKKNKTTKQQEFHYIKLKDRYKRIKAIQEGYYYLEIPYWTDDKNETWKQLIDNKINEILILKEVI